MNAAQDRDLRRLRDLLDAGADPNSTVERPWPVGGQDGPALRIAAAAGDEEMVVLLLDRGADINQAAALATAAEYGHRATVRLLLERGAAPAATNGEGRTALQAALVAGQLEVAADLAKRDRPGLLVAVLTGQVDLIDDATNLMQATGMPGVTLLHIAARAGQTAIVGRLLDLGAPLEVACEPCATWLGSPLGLAARAGHATTVRFLLDRGADPNQMAGSQSVLVAAASANHDEVVRVLVAHGAEVDRDQDLQPPLCAAAIAGHVEAMAALLDLGAAIDRPNASGLTPLRLAAGQGHMPAVELLIERNATIDPKLPAEIRTARYSSRPERLESISRLLERRGR